MSFRTSLVLQEVVFISGGLIPHGLDDTTNRSALAGTRAHISLQLVIDGRKTLGLVLLPHFLVDGLVVDHPELIFGVVRASVQEFGAQKLCAAQLKTSVELIELLGVRRTATIHTHGKDALIGNLSDTRVEARGQANLASGLARRKEDLQLGQSLVDEIDELLDRAGGYAEILDNVFIGKTRLVKGVVACAAVEEWIGETASDAILRYVEMCESKLASPESTVIVTEEVVSGGHVDSARLIMRRLLLDQLVLDSVRKPVHLHLLENVARLWRLLNETAEHDDDLCLSKVHTVDEVNLLVVDSGLEQLVRLVDIIDAAHLDLDVRHGRDELDGHKCDNAESTKAAGSVLEKVLVVRAAGSLEGAISQNNLNVADSIVEKTVSVHAALAGEAGVSSSNGDALELHDNLGNDALLQTMRSKIVHGNLRLSLNGHCFEIDREDAVHVAGVDDLVPGKGHRPSRASRAMVNTELLLVVVEVLDTVLNASHGGLVLLHEFRGILCRCGHLGLSIALGACGVVYVEATSLER